LRYHPQLAIDRGIEQCAVAFPLGKSGHTRYARDNALKGRSGLSVGDVPVPIAGERTNPGGKMILEPPLQPVIAADRFHADTPAGRLLAVMRRFGVFDPMPVDRPARRIRRAA
jgi:hypothetical protein